MASLSKILFAGLFGILYILFGITMILSPLIPVISETIAPYGIPADPVAGGVLSIVGVVFVFAYRELGAGTAEGHAFLYIGMGLAVVFGIAALLSRGAQGVEILLFEDGGSWGPLQLFVPMLYLALLPAAGLFTWGRSFLRDLFGA